MEKLWRGRMKAPEPDLEEILATSRKHGNSLTLPHYYQSRQITPEQSHSKGYWPPPNSSSLPHSASKPHHPTQRSQTQRYPPQSPKKVNVVKKSATTVCTTTLPIEVTRKAVNLMSPAVFNSWLPTKPVTKPEEDHFKELLNIW